MRPKVLVTSALFPQAERLLALETDATVHRGGEPMGYKDIREEIRNKEGLLCMLYDKIDAGVMEVAPGLRVISNMAAGLDNIEMEEATRKRVVVTHTPGILTEATADLGWALLMATARLIPQADKFSREGKFRGWRPRLFLGRDLVGKTLGIYGMGRIGTKLAKRAKGFDMKIVYYNRRPNRDAERKTGARYLSFQELLRKSDFLVITAPLTPKTRGRFGTREFREMKREAILINIGRGPIVKEGELVQALKEGSIWGAGLDVYEDEPQMEEELLECDRVVLLPHIGSATEETRARMALTAAQDLVRVLRGEAPLYSPNWGEIVSK